MSKYRKDPFDKNPLIWLLFSIAIMCCIITIAGGYFWFRPDKLSSLLTKCDPLRVAITAQPFTEPQPTANSPVTITAFDDSSTDYPNMRDLATSDSQTTWPHIFPLAIKSDMSVVVSIGWCASSESVLNENLHHIQFLLEADGKSIDVKTLYQNNFVVEGQFCMGYDGVIKKWFEGQHTVSRTIKIDQDTDNGSICYPEGEYSEIFLVTVTP